MPGLAPDDDELASTTTTPGVRRVTPRPVQYVMIMMYGSMAAIIVFMAVVATIVHRRRIVHHMSRRGGGAQRSESFDTTATSSKEVHALTKADMAMKVKVWRSMNKTEEEIMKLQAEARKLQRDHHKADILAAIEAAKAGANVQARIKKTPGS